MTNRSARGGREAMIKKRHGTSQGVKGSGGRDGVYRFMNDLLLRMYGKHERFLGTALFPRPVTASLSILFRVRTGTCCSSASEIYI
jgi:hypothetical protein